MAPKLAADDNVTFLYLCYQHAGSPQIDFNGLGSALNLKPGAARMRFYRLRDKLEPSVRTAGTPVAKPATKRKMEAIPKKRPRPKQQKVASVEELLTKRQTRGKKIDFSSALDSDSEDSGHGEEDSEDVYDSGDEQMEGGSDDLSSVDSCAPAGPAVKVEESAFRKTSMHASDRMTTPVGFGGMITTSKVIPDWQNLDKANSARSGVDLALSSPAVQLTPPATEKSRKSLFTLQDTDHGFDGIKEELKKYNPGRFIPLNPDAFFHQTNAQSGGLEANRHESAEASSTTLYSKSKASSYVTATEDDDDDEDNGVDNTSIGPDDSVSGTGKYSRTTAEDETPAKPVTSYFGRLWGR